MKELLANYALIAGLIAWSLAQIVKVPLEYIQTRKWNWALLLRAGGMPSSHSALVVAIAYGTGLFGGFNQPIFALAVALAMVVVYDATGIRRQAGMQAQTINILVDELLKGHPISEQHLREVLGHTPLEALGGVILGLVLAVGLWFWWR